MEVKLRRNSKSVDLPSISIFDIGKFVCRYVKHQDGCWLWQTNLDKDGYGRFYYNGREHKAHRISYFHHNKIQPGLLLVCHSCDTPACVNPEHLYLGDDKQNHRDMVVRGRSTACENHPGAKLNSKQIEEIKQVYAEGELTQVEIGAMFLISGGMVSRIVGGQSWKNSQE
jgi:hypothetical protein